MYAGERLDDDGYRIGVPQVVIQTSHGDDINKEIDAMRDIFGRVLYPPNLGVLLKACSPQGSQTIEGFDVYYFKSGDSIPDAVVPGVVNSIDEIRTEAHHLGLRGDLGELSLPLGQICERMNFYVVPQEDEAVLRRREISAACSVIIAKIEEYAKTHEVRIDVAIFSGDVEKGHCHSHTYPSTPVID